MSDERSSWCVVQSCLLVDSQELCIPYIYIIKLAIIMYDSNKYDIYMHRSLFVFPLFVLTGFPTVCFQIGIN